MPNGEIQEEFVTRLHAVGEWMSRFGDSIYGTRGGPVAPADWGVTTQKGDKVYVHVLRWDAPLLALPPIQKQIASAHQLLGGETVQFTQNTQGVVLTLPEAGKNTVDRVVVLTVAAQPQEAAHAH
jgi:alpha-L-fucosidase